MPASGIRTPARTPARPSARTRLLDAAARLFYANGITNTGIDAVIAEAGVAKKSLYNNFASKDDLIGHYIEERHAEWLELFQMRADAAVTPQQRILAVFDAYVDHASMAYPHGFRGCGLLNAAAELPAGSAGREATAQHKAEVEGMLRTELVRLTDAGDAAVLAEHLSFLLEGAMARAGLEASPERLLHARTLAERLIGAL